MTSKVGMLLACSHLFKRTNIVYNDLLSTSGGAKFEHEHGDSMALIIHLYATEGVRTKTQTPADWKKRILRCMSLSGNGLLSPFLSVLVSHD